MQFRLRTLLLLFIPCALALGGLGWLFRGESTEAKFCKDTGLPWPPSAKIVEQADDHGGFTGDGRYVLVFDCEPEELQAWLSAEPPWRRQEWQEGPVPLKMYGPPVPWIMLSHSVKVWYATRTRGHNGKLLMFDPDGGRVWFCSWDF